MLPKVGQTVVSDLLIDFSLKMWTLLIARWHGSPVLQTSSFSAAKMDCDFQSAKFYCFVELKNDSTPIQIYRKLLVAFPDSCHHSTIKLWCRDFISGKRTRVEDEERPGRPKSARIEDNFAEVKRLIQENARHSARSLSLILNINKTTVLKILKEDLKMRRLCSVWVPKLLSDDHRKKRVESAKCILNELSNLGECAPSRYCVEDETWVNFNPMLPKQENKTWVKKSAKRHAIPRPTLTKKKTLLMICLTADKFSVKALPYGDTITSDVYVEFLKAMGEVEEAAQSSSQTERVILSAWQCETTFG